jgi:tetratricopeptide (TPR) repeat protein
LRGQSRNNPQQIAEYIEMLIRHGRQALCPEWLDRLAEMDIDPIRQTALRVRWLHAARQTAEAAPLIENAAQKWMGQAANAAERARTARAVGDMYLAIDQLPLAEPWYRKTADNDPSQFSMLVLALARQGDFDSAIRICRTQAQTEESSRPALVLASALIDSQAPPQRIAEANSVLAAAVAKFPKDIALLYRVATLRAFEVNYREAIRLYREVLKLDPKHVAALNNLATMLAEFPRDRAEALTVIDEAIAIMGQLPELLDTKGAVLIHQGRADQAIALLEAAARENKSDARHRFHLAAAYRDVGNLEQAKQYLQSAIDQHLDRQFLTQLDHKLLIDLKATLIP